MLRPESTCQHRSALVRITSVPCVSLHPPHLVKRSSPDSNQNALRSRSSLAVSQYPSPRACCLMWLAPLQTSRWSDSIRFGNRFAGWFRRTMLFIGRSPPLVLFLCSFQLTRVSYLSRLASLRTRQNRPTFPLSFRVLVRQPWPPSRPLDPTMCIFLHSSSL